MAIPNAQPIQISKEITIQAPLTRRGTGPGLILLVPSSRLVEVANHMSRGVSRRSTKALDPEPLKKWAEEGYAVAQIAWYTNMGNLSAVVGQAIVELGKMKECEGSEKIGLVGE